MNLVHLWTLRQYRLHSSTDDVFLVRPRSGKPMETCWYWHRSELDVAEAAKSSSSSNNDAQEFILIIGIEEGG